jgi:SCP-2 sterol transfer family
MNEVDTVIQTMKDRINGDVLTQIDAVIGVDIGGKGAYTIDARAVGGQGMIEGDPASHNLESRFSFAISADDFVKLMNGQLNAMAAAMTGKLKLKGDMAYAMKLAALFN